MAAAWEIRADMIWLGVMRFLQTEWHRHERDRNAWEIERQEMRVRIASLEGSGRRSDVQQKGLRKYVKMLEKALAAERKKGKTANGVSEEVEEDKTTEGSKLKPHSRCMSSKARFTEDALTQIQLQPRNHIVHCWKYDQKEKPRKKRSPSDQI
jgi:hypothetical protein